MDSLPGRAGAATRRARGRRRQGSSATLLLLVPSVVLFAVFFAWPLIQLGVSSLHAYSRLTGVLPGLTLDNYIAIASGDDYRIAIVRTLRIALGTCALSLVLGYPVALYTNAAPARQKGLIILCIISPLLVSVIVRTFGWLIIFGPNGLLDNLARALGASGLSILHSDFAVVLGLTNVLLPFLVLSILTSLQSIDPALGPAAGSLGADPLRVFWRVILPLTLPGMSSGLLIVFSLASSSFVTPALLGGGDHRVLSMVMYEQALVLQNWPLASAIAAVMMLLVLLILLLQDRLFGGARGAASVAAH